MIDTQIFLRAAINPKSLPAKIVFDRVDAYELIISPAIRAEVYDVLTRPALRSKFDLLTDEVTQRVLNLFVAATWVTPHQVTRASRDPKDDIFLACAKEGKATYLVSEDQDLLSLTPYHGIPIINALDFMKLLEAQ